MVMLGRRLWDDDGFAIASILPKFGNINLGSAQHPFENIFVNQLNALVSSTITDDLTVNDDAAVGGDLAVTGDSTFTGDVNADGEIISALGAGLTLVEGANGRAGLATLAGGTKTVSTNAVAAGARIILTRQTPGGTEGHLSAPTASIVADTSFVINSSSGTDTSTVYWVIVNPA